MEKILAYKLLFHFGSTKGVFDFSNLYFNQGRLFEQKAIRVIVVLFVAWQKWQRRQLRSIMNSYLQKYLILWSRWCRPGCGAAGWIITSVDWIWITGGAGFPFKQPRKNQFQRATRWLCECVCDKIKSVEMIIWWSKMPADRLTAHELCISMEFSCIWKALCFYSISW